MTKAEELALNDEGKGCLGRSADNEPVFILCGRDPVAGQVVREWALLRELRARGLNTLDERERAKLKEAREHADRMDAWPKKAGR